MFRLKVISHHEAYLPEYKTGYTFLHLIPISKRTCYKCLWGKIKFIKKCIRDISKDCLPNPPNRNIKIHLKRSRGDFVDHIRLAEDMVQ